jgi:hypothetical protein
MCGLVACHVGDMKAGEEAIKPLRQFGPPALDLTGPIPFPALNSMFDPLLPPGLLHYWKADFVQTLSDAAIEAHVKYGPHIPTVSSAMHIYPVNGAVHRIGRNDTAYSFRDANFVHVIAAMYTDPSTTQKNVQWVRDYWSALHPHSAGGAYVNFMMDEAADRVQATYRDNYDRLVAIKKKLDPTNLFRLNQNIPPGT